MAYYSLKNFVKIGQIIQKVEKTHTNEHHEGGGVVLIFCFFEK